MTPKQQFNFDREARECEARRETVLQEERDGDHGNTTQPGNTFALNMDGDLLPARSDGALFDGHRQ